ncbi:MAG: molybdopterin-dependent oxidoreductase [Desulfobacteraceae bacterium]|nr:molybdopterin-dependent oxidoreductase [Desulfobacteraceae bacterium]
MSVSKIFSVCGMCTVRCPIMVETENGQISFLQGNPNVAAMKGAVCPRGAAGISLIKDSERPQFPMIRDGERGSGKWRKVSWEEALDYTAQKLKQISDTYGAKSIAFSDRGGPFQDLHKAFVKGLGTPNYINHDASCARNVDHACTSVTGLGRKDWVYDFKNAKHVILQFRNIFEAVNVQEVNNLMDGLENGCKLTVIDIRANISATKADRFFMIRPGTDYAFNLAVIHELLAGRLYDEQYAAKWIQDFDKLEAFITPYTPEWAEAETGISAAELRRFVRELAQAKPSVIWHPGWMTARYRHSFYVCRSIYIINALLGAFGAKGGLPLANKPANFGKTGLKALADLYPKPADKRADGAGWKYPHISDGPGLAHLMYKAMDTDDPYPVKAYIAYRHDPLMGFPDPDRLKQIFSKLDFLVSVTFSWSDVAWYSDLILPLSPYLERESIIACKNGLKPYFFVRKRAVEPRFDTKADWEIISGLSKRLGLDKLSFDSMSDIWKYQLQDTGVSIGDFEATGIVALADAAKYREIQDTTFKTPSKKIELISEKLEKQGLASLMPYSSPQARPQGQFRLTFGRCALHTQGHTVNNPMLSEQMPENVLWINTAEAQKLGISDGATVRVSQNGYSETIKAKVTDLIHPEAVFVIHGFGHALPIETRAFGKGLADNKFMKGGLDIWDPAGGAVAFQEHFVTVAKA